MTEREKIISLADDAGFSTIDDEYGGIQVTDSGNKWITERIVAFYKLAQKDALANAKVSIPTDAMEQAFQHYHTLGYQKGKKDAFEEAAKLVDEMQDECEPWMCGDDVRQLIKE